MCGFQDIFHLFIPIYLKKLKEKLMLLGIHSRKNELSTYYILKNSYETEPYVRKVMNQLHRSALAQLSVVNVHYG